MRDFALARCSHPVGWLGLVLLSLLWPVLGCASPSLSATAVVVQDYQTGRILYQKQAQQALPIASLTKLMAAMVLLDAKPNMAEMLTITDDDVDRLKFSSSRLPVGTRLSRETMLKLSLMSSENRAAHALARHYPGGVAGFVQAMNVKARQLGLAHTRFVEPTGLSPANRASALDVARLASEAARYPAINRYSTMSADSVAVRRGVVEQYRNSNSFVREGMWPIQLSKTGYIREAGRCLAMVARIEGRQVLIVLLNAADTQSRTKDALALKNWLTRARQATAGSAVGADTL